MRPAAEGAPAASSDAGTVVVGGGLAGTTVAKQLRAEGYTAPVTVLVDETDPPYDRPPLSKAMLSGAGPGEVALLTDDEAAGIDLRHGVVVTGLDPQRKVVLLADGTALPYEHCVIATGSRARRLPDLPDVDGVHYLRSMANARALRRALQKAERAVVVGAGFIGLEVASSALDLGVAVTVVEREAMPLTRVLGSAAGDVVADLCRTHGVDLRCGSGVGGLRTRTDADGRQVVEGVELADGQVLPADVVVLGAGAVPNVEWLDGSGVPVEDGVVCDTHGRTGLPGLWAAGDVARWPNSVTGLHVRVEQWQSALEQAAIVAANIVHGEPLRGWDSVPYFWSDQFGRKIQFCGHPGESSRVYRTDAGPVVAFGRQDALTGVLSIGQPRVLARARRLVAAGGTWADLADLVGATP